MKAFFFSFLIVLFCSKSYSQTVNSSCDGSESVVKRYKNTADKLAILRSVKTGNTYKDSVVINRQLSTNYLKALLAVYNASLLPARDTIVAIGINLDYKLFPAFNYLYFDADTNKIWIKNLKNNIIPCGNSSIDYLLSKYYLKFINYNNIVPLPPSTFNLGLTFKTDTNFYMNRLCDKFNALYPQGIGVGNASPQTLSSLVFDITDSINPNFTELTYRAGWGDCMAGCIYKRYWTFRVYNDCSVEYKGSYGNPLTFDIFAGIKNNETDANGIKYYPNPVQDKLNIDFENLNETPKNLKIINLLGETVYTRSGLKQNSEIDVSFLPGGIYYLNIGRGKINYKFVVNR